MSECNAIEAIASKSYSIRAIAAASLCNATSIIDNIGYCDDVNCSIDAAIALGATTQKVHDTLKITGTQTPHSDYLNLKESGLALRLFTSISALSKQKVTIDAEKSLLKRHTLGIESVFKQLGKTLISNNECPPFTLTGNIKGNVITIDASDSSQLLSGLLFVLPLCRENSILKVKNLVSKPYISMTLYMLEKYGIEIENFNFSEFKIKGNQTYKSCDLKIEGDWSAMAFLAVAGAIAGKTIIKNLNYDSLQADRKLLDVFDIAKVKYSINSDNLIFNKSEINAFDFNATDCPDLFAPLSILACWADGTSKIYGTHRLTNKESNRTIALQEGLIRLGIDAKIDSNKLIITGAKIQPATINSHSDHRIAMAFSLAKFASGADIQVNDIACISKSYPNYFADLKCVTIL